MHGERRLQLDDFFFRLSEHRRKRGPIETDLRRALLQFHRHAASAGRARGTSSSTERYARMLSPRSAFSSALIRSQKSPSELIAQSRISEDMRVTPNHLPRDGISYVGEVEARLLSRHVRVIDDLQQEIAELVLEPIEVITRDHIRDLIGFLDGVGRDRREGLLARPTRRAALGVAQAAKSRRSKILECDGAARAGSSAI